MNSSEPEILTLYQTVFCPYCERVRGALRRLGASISTRDINANVAWRQELVAATGRQTVPCLRIERNDGSFEWMHESADIIDYLQQELSA